jgi:hypothetical protein
MKKTMRYAVIDSSQTVVNAIAWDGKSRWQPPSECVVVEMPETAGIGWTYVNGEFIAPPEPEVTE